MQLKTIKKKHIIFLIPLILILSGTFALANFALAQSCPNVTTVTGTTVNFVGEVTDMGGDSTVTGWFEYGQTTGYGQTTSQKILSQLGIYCITVSNLSPCTAYHYRAAAQNSAGTTFGENKTFTTSCGPTVDLKANGSDGPISVAYGSSVTLTWISSSANSCQASGDWTGYKSTSGSQTISNLTSSKTFTLNCSGSAGSVSDNVTVNIGSPSLSVSLSPSPSSGCVPLNGVDLTGSVSGNFGGDIVYFFDCTNDGTWEKITTYYSNSYTAYDVCNFGSTGNYTAKVKIENQGVSAENTANINVLSCQSPVSVDLKINGYDGSIALPYNSIATLTWTSNNANYCTASGDWSGSKSISGSESTGNLFSSKSYSITCTGSGGSNTDTATVNMTSTGILTVNKWVRNLSDGTGWLDSVSADPSEVISFLIEVTAVNSSLQNVTVKDTLPDKMTYRTNTLKIDGVSSAGDIFSGLNIGSLSANQKETITFDADISGADGFVFGDTQLINSALVYTGNTSGSDTAKVIVTKRAVAGATTISTGLTNNIFIDSFLIPLVIALTLIWLLRSNIIKLEQWLDTRKMGYQKYRSTKLLQIKIAKAKTQELFRSRRG